ncbi:hypothetical protein [Actinomadura atramentaria]|uniref:hypothetical protein n=1 Tax=Actinomadura atramentaria TaxID=1990 RepID=UPI000367DDA0|nr:hypothetical protein [Actinomadura atramentaria]
MNVGFGESTGPAGGGYGGRARLIVAGVTVVAVPKIRAQGEGALIVVATDRAQAAALTGAGGYLAVTISPG